VLTKNPTSSKTNLGANIFQTIKCLLSTNTEIAAKKIFLKFKKFIFKNLIEKFIREINYFKRAECDKLKN
jgi:hypothetical protein